MMFGCSKNFLFAVSILVGTIVGAGIFGIPYVISRSGMIPGLFYLIFMGGVLFLIHLFYGEVVLRTKERHHLPALAGKYLGRKGKILATIFTVVGAIGILLAHIIIGGEFLKIIFSSFVSLPNFYFSLFFLFFLAYFIFRGIKLIAPTELATNLVFFTIVFLIFLFALPKINLENVALLNFSGSFLPYGVILFSLVGFSAIPIVGTVLKSEDEKKEFKKVLISAFSIVVLLYLFFSLTIVGVSGARTSPEALQGLIPFLGRKIIFFGALAAVITLADTFLTVALYLRNTLIYDYKFSKFAAFIFTCGTPLVLFLLGFRSFIETIGFFGTIIGTLEGIIIILIFKKFRETEGKRPEFSFKVSLTLLYFLIIILILGAASQFL